MKVYRYRSTKVIYGLLAFAFTATFTSCGAPDDNDIQRKVTEQLQADTGLKNISAKVKEGEVTLSGNCDAADCDSLAEERVKAVEGVKSVRLSIQKEVSTDLTLRTAVQTIVSKYEGVQADVAGGVIVLRGSVEKKNVQQLTEELQALKPKKLDNQLAIH